MSGAAGGAPLAIIPSWEELQRQKAPYNRKKYRQEKIEEYKKREAGFGRPEELSASGAAGGAAGGGPAPEKETKKLTWKNEQTSEPLANERYIKSGNYMPKTAEEIEADEKEVAATLARAEEEWKKYQARLWDWVAKNPDLKFANDENENNGFTNAYGGARKRRTSKKASKKFSKKSRRHRKSRRA